MNNRIVHKALNPRVILRKMLVFTAEIFHWKDSRKYLEVLYRLYTGKRLNLENPKTYTEKIQWLKLYYNITPECTMMADKYKVREYVEKTIGGDYLIPLLGVWNRFEDIDFDSLPQRFVLKTTHDSGGIVICKDKNSFDFEAARRKINKHLRRNYFWEGREEPYRNIEPRIVAEEYIINEKNQDLPDYKLFCFNGKPEILFYASNRFNELGQPPYFTYYDMELNVLPIRSKGHDTDPRPVVVDGWEEMKRLSERLSSGHPHLRIDFYNVNGKIYFGEITFHHDGGFVPFIPQEWDEKLGDLIILPKETKNSI